MSDLKLATAGVKSHAFPENGQREILSAALRTARNRVYLLMTEMDEVGVALKHNMVSPEVAVGWLRDIDALYFVNPDIWREPSSALKAVAA